MPFFEAQRPIDDLTNLAPPDEPEGIDPSIGETFAAAFRTQNVLGSWMASRGQPDPYEIEDGFESIQYFIDNGLETYVEEAAGIFNRKAADAKMIQIRREEQDNRTLAAAGGVGVVAQMGAGFFDLPTLFPVGGAAIGAGRGIGGAALRVGAAAGLDATASEAALQATQATRTAGESAINIGGSVVLGGALGALVGRYMKPVEATALAKKIEAQEEAFDNADRAFIGAGQSAGAAARDRGPLKLKDERLIKALPGVNIQDPLIRSQLSDFSSTRETVRRLAETPLEYRENAQGIATERGGSVETRVKMWNAPTAEGLRSVDTIYARYFHAVPEPSSWQVRLSPLRSEFDRARGASTKLTYKQFKEEVGRAAFSAEQHAIPEVAQAAKVYRQWDESLKTAAIEARLFPEDVAVSGDVSHLFRMYDQEKIIARRDTWTARLVDYLTAERAKAGFRAEENEIAQRILKSDAVAGRFDRAFQRLDQVERRLEGRQDSRQRRVGALENARSLRRDVMSRRAPAAMVKALRNADANASAIEAVRDSRKMARSAGRKQSYAEKYPVLAEVKRRGGVRVGSVLDRELRAMDVTPQTHPGLFRKNGGLGDIDNWVKSEDDIFDTLADDGAGYVDRNSLFEAIRGEVGGSPLRTPDQIAEDQAFETLDQVASEWLEDVGLPANATVKDVRDFIGRVLGAEKELDALDAKVSRLEQEIEGFDRTTDDIRTERAISEAEARKVADELDDLDRSLDDVQEIANASPRIRAMVDYGRARRDLFKARLKERHLRSRNENIDDLRSAGRANDEMLAEHAANKVEMERLDTQIGKLIEKTERLSKARQTASQIEGTEEFANLSDAELRSLVDEITDTILGNASGRLPYDGIVSGPRGALKSRTLKISSEKIADFMELDIETVMRAQVRTMAPDIEIARKFGSVDMAEEIRKINDEANAKIDAAKTEKERTRLQRQRERDIRDIEGIRDRLRGNYALPSNPSSLVIRASRVARNLNYIRLLGGMTLSAIPDMAKIVFTHGLTSTFRDGFVPLVRSARTVRLAGKEVQAAGTALDMILDSRTMAMADITDDFGRHSKLERGLSALSSKFGIMSLMAPWNAAMKQFAGLVTMTNLLRSAQRLAKGTASKSEITRLAAAGIDADLASRIAREFEAHGEITDGVWLAQTGRWSDKAAKEAVRAAVVRDVDRIIVTPGQDKPLWMSTELGKVVGQFKSFSVSSMQRTMLSGLQQRDAAALNGVLLMLGLGAVTYAVKEKVADRELSDDPRVWAVNALDRSGLTGWLMEANNISEKATRGRVGLSAISGEQVSRYASRNVYGAFLGPSADAVADIFQVSGSIFAGDTTKSDLRRARQLLPGQNLFYLRSMFNAVEEATGDALDLPDTRRN